MVHSNIIIYIQLYQRRKKYLKENEKEVWETINENYMTEESDGSSGESFRQHSLTWRSDSMLIKNLCVHDVLLCQQFISQLCISL